MVLCFDSGTYLSVKIKKEIERHIESKQTHTLKDFEEDLLLLGREGPVYPI